MNDAVIDVIEAFADGEAVDPTALRHALADAAGRDHLIDVLTLRAMVGGEPAARPAVAMPTPAATPRVSWALWIPAAAAVLLIGGITGYLAGSRTVPVPAPASTAVEAAAPAPTQVIQLRQGVDWTERAGGQ